MTTANLRACPDPHTLRIVLIVAPAAAETDVVPPPKQPSWDVRLQSNVSVGDDIGSQPKYHVERELGKGGFAKVFACSHPDGNEYAVKVVRKHELQSAMSVSNELEVLQQSHMRIVRVHEVQETEFHHLIVMERGQVDLHTYLFDPDHPHFLRNMEASHVFQQLLDGTAFIHSKSIIHGDLKLENILVFSEVVHEEWTELSVKITDFGLCKKLEGPLARTSTDCGTPCFKAPEVILGIPYATEVDYFSLGVCLYELLIRQAPATQMPSLEENKLAELELYDESSLKTLPVGAQALIRGLLEVDGTKRFEYEDCCRNVWLAWAQYMILQRMFPPVFKAGASPCSRLTRGRVEPRRCQIRTMTKSGMRPKEKQRKRAYRAGH